MPQRTSDDRLVCIECGVEASGAETIDWRAYLTDDLDDEVPLYCPTCALREFGPLKNP